jgi:hypothetical protein
MKLLKTPAVDWPEGFEVYDPKVTNNFKNSTSGVSGTKTIEYLAIPRAGGSYTIPAIPFSYYDTQADTYRTLSTPEYTLTIERDNTTDSPSNGAVISSPNQVKEDIKQLGSDIRYIHTTLPASSVSNNSAQIAKVHSPFALRLIAIGYIFPALLASLLFVVFRKRIKENADITRVRYKKANKVAQQRLKLASQLLRENQKERFYEEIERAAWSYLSDRLSIPTAQLGKQNIADILTNKGVDQTIISKLLEVLSTAEFARYAPTSEHAMQDLYNATTTIINELENCRL